MKLSTAILLYATQTLAHDDADFNSGVYHGAEVAEHLWSESGNCSNLWSFEETVKEYLGEHYPTDTGNWRSDAYNVGVEAGAGQVVEKYEKECYVEPIENCSEGTDCRTCLSNSACTWFDDIGHCETGCGMEGCGATICPEELKTCEDCLGGPGTPASGQYSWVPSANECLTDCMWIADTSCYKAKSSADPSGYSPSDCEEINKPSSCAGATDCESCLSNSGCTWFQDIGHCEDGCGMEGCGATVCPAEISTCEDCLGGPGTPSSGQYSWVPADNECLADCSMIADTSCYKAKSSADPSGYDPSDCDQISAPSTCEDATDCESCTSNSECTWFADSSRCQTMCGELGCGATICAAEITTCEECLAGSGTPTSGQYSWSPYTNECVEHCRFAPPDAPCYNGKKSYDQSGYDPSVCEEIGNKTTTSGTVAIA